MADVEHDALAVNACCPRCGGGFHCGAQGSTCDCALIQLDDATRAALRLRFEGCLCTSCLRALQAGRNAAAADRGRSAIAQRAGALPRP